MVGVLQLSAISPRSPSCRARVYIPAPRPNPKHQTLKFKPDSRNPQPSTLIPKPISLDPKPSTLNPKP